MQLKNRLIQMINGTYLYRAKEHKISGFEIMDGTTFVSTDLGLLKFPTESCEQILRNEFIQVDSKNLPIKAPLQKDHNLQTYNKINAESIAAALNKTITDLTSDKITPEELKKKVSQAKAVNNTINTYMNLIKTEITVKKFGGK